MSFLCTTEQTELYNLNMNFTNVTIFLGMYIMYKNSKFNWKTQIRMACSKLNKLCYSLKKFSQVANKFSCRVFYFSNVHSILSYRIV